MEKLVEQFAPGSRVARSWAMGGGVSAQVTGLEIVRSDGAVERFAVRRHGPRDLAGNPHVAAQEYRVLELLTVLGLPVPRPVHLDETCTLLPSPYIVVEYIEGTTDCGPGDSARVNAVAQMATVLSRIHRVNTRAFGFLPRQEPPSTATSLNRIALLHGDFWPGNILWRNSILAGVIDWEDARLGDPLADVANARLEIRWALGAEAMGDFTERYRAVAAEVDLADLPHWDIKVAIHAQTLVSQWGLDKVEEHRMMGELRAFLADAAKAKERLV